MPLLELSRTSCEEYSRVRLPNPAQRQLPANPTTWQLPSVGTSYLLRHLVGMMQRVFPLMEHPLLLGAGQTARQPGG